MNAKHTKKLYLGTDGGVYLSLDRGATWLFLQNLPVGQFYHVAVDNVTPYRIYGGLQDNGTWMAPSSAPGGLSNSHWQSIYWGDGFWAQPDPADPDRKSTRLNSSHQIISYAVFCLKKKKINLKTSHNLDIFKIISIAYAIVVASSGKVNPCTHILYVTFEWYVFVSL